MEKPRRTYTPEQKVSILREHLIERTPVSDLCDKHGIHPTLFYQWQKTFFEREEPLLKPEGPPLGIWAAGIEKSKPSKTSWPCAAKLWPSLWKNMCV